MPVDTLIPGQVGTPKRNNAVLRDIGNVTPNGGTPSRKRQMTKTPSQSTHQTGGLDAAGCIVVTQNRAVTNVDDPKLLALLQMQNKKATEGIVLEREGVHFADVQHGQSDESSILPPPLKRDDSLATSSPIDLGDGGTAIDNDLRAKLERQNKRSARGIVLERDGVHTADVQHGQASSSEPVPPTPKENAAAASSSPVDLGAGDIAIEGDLKAKLERQNKRANKGIVLTHDGENLGLPHYEASKYAAPPQQALQNMNGNHAGSIGNNHNNDNNKNARTDPQPQNLFKKIDCPQPEAKPQQSQPAHRAQPSAKGGRSKAGGNGNAAKKNRKSMDPRLRSLLQLQNAKAMQGVVLESGGRDDDDDDDADACSRDGAVVQPSPGTPLGNGEPVDIGAGDISVEADLRRKLERMQRRAAHGIVLTRDGEETGLPHYDDSGRRTREPTRFTAAEVAATPEGSKARAAADEHAKPAKLQKSVSIQPVVYMPPVCVDTPKQKKIKGTPQKFDLRRAMEQRAKADASHGTADAGAARPTPIKKIPPSADVTPIKRIDADPAPEPEQEARAPAEEETVIHNPKEEEKTAEGSVLVASMSMLEAPEEEGGKPFEEGPCAPAPTPLKPLAGGSEAEGGVRSGIEARPDSFTTPTKALRPAGARAATTGKKLGGGKISRFAVEGKRIAVADKGKSPDLGDGGRLVDEELKSALRRQNKRAMEGTVASPAGGWARLRALDLSTQGTDDSQLEESVNLGDGGAVLESDLKAMLKRQNRRANQGIVLRNTPQASGLPRYDNSSRAVRDPTRFTISAAETTEIPPDPQPAPSRPSRPPSVAPSTVATAPAPVPLVAAPPEPAMPPEPAFSPARLLHPSAGADVDSSEPQPAAPSEAAPPISEPHSEPAAAEEACPPPKRAASPEVLRTKAPEGRGSKGASGAKESRDATKESRDLAEAYIRQLHIDPRIVAPRQHAKGKGSAGGSSAAVGGSNLKKPKGPGPAASADSSALAASGAGGVGVDGSGVPSAEAEARRRSSAESSVQSQLWEALMRSQNRSRGSVSDAETSLASVSAASSRPGSIMQPKTTVTTTVTTTTTTTTTRFVPAPPQPQEEDGAGGLEGSRAEGGDDGQSTLLTNMSAVSGTSMASAVPLVDDSMATLPSARGPRAPEPAVAGSAAEPTTEERDAVSPGAARRDHDHDGDHDRDHDKNREGGVRLDWSMLAEAGSPAYKGNSEASLLARKGRIDFEDAIIHRTKHIKALHTASPFRSASTASKAPAPAKPPPAPAPAPAAAVEQAAPAQTAPEMPAAPERSPKRASAPTSDGGDRRDGGASSPLKRLKTYTVKVGDSAQSGPHAPPPEVPQIGVEWNAEELGMIKEDNGMQCAFC